jgi:hypothetical protein
LLQYEYEGIGTAKITQLHFDMFGNSFGITDQSGNLGLWRFGSSEHNAKVCRENNLRHSQSVCPCNVVLIISL